MLLPHIGEKRGDCKDNLNDPRGDKKSGVVGKLKPPKGENGRSWWLKMSFPSNGVVGEIKAKGEGSNGLWKRGGVLLPLELSDDEDVFEVSVGKMIFDSVNDGMFDFGFGLEFWLVKDLISSDSGRPFSSILFFFEYLRSLQGARVFFPSESTRILFEIEALNRFLMLLSVLPGIRSAIVDHFEPYLR